VNGNQTPGTSPEVRPLPNHEKHRKELLTAIQAESEVRSPRPAGDGRRGWGGSGWLGPVAVAAGVVVIAGATVAVHGLVQGAGGSPGARQTQQAATPAGGATIAGTTQVTSQPIRVNDQWSVTSSFQVTSRVTTLVVNDPVGSVTVTGADTNKVSVTAVIRYGATAPSVTRNLSTAGSLALGYSACNDCGVAFRVTVPSGTDIRVTEGTGNVTLAGVHGSVDVQAHTGNVTATALTGPSGQFRVTVGQIDAGFAAPPTQVDAATGTGSVTIRLPSSATYQVAASSGVGPASVAVPQAAHAGHVVTATAGVGAVTVTSAG